jgi:hypothetical protein
MRRRACTKLTDRAFVLSCGLRRRYSNWKRVEADKIERHACDVSVSPLGACASAPEELLASFRNRRPRLRREPRGWLEELLDCQYLRNAKIQP